MHTFSPFLSVNSLQNKITNSCTDQIDEYLSRAASNEHQHRQRVREQASSGSQPKVQKNQETRRSRALGSRDVRTPTAREGRNSTGRSRQWLPGVAVGEQQPVLAGDQGGRGGSRGSRRWQLAIAGQSGSLHARVRHVSCSRW